MCVCVCVCARARVRACLTELDVEREVQVEAAHASDLRRVVKELKDMDAARLATMKSVLRFSLPSPPPFVCLSVSPADTDALIMHIYTLSFQILRRLAAVAADQGAAARRGALQVP